MGEAVAAAMTLRLLGRCCWHCHASCLHRVRMWVEMVGGTVVVERAAQVPAPLRRRWLQLQVKERSTRRSHHQLRPEGLPELREGLLGLLEGLIWLRERLLGLLEGLPGLLERLPWLLEGLPGLLERLPWLLEGLMELPELPPPGLPELPPRLPGLPPGLTGLLGLRVLRALERLRVLRVQA